MLKIPIETAKAFLRPKTGSYLFENYLPNSWLREAFTKTNILRRIEALICSSFFELHVSRPNVGKNEASRPLVEIIATLFSYLRPFFLIAEKINALVVKF